MKTDNDLQVELLLQENQGLRARLEEAEQIIRAIRHDEVDALVVTGPHGEQVHTIEAAERPYRLLVENAKDYAIFTLDPEGCCSSWNAGAERLLGYTAEEILGKPCGLIFTPEDRARGVPEQELRVAVVDGRSEDDRYHVRKDGTRFYASGVTTPFLNGHGKFLGFVKIMRDLSEQKRTDEEIRTLNAKLQRAIIETHHRVKNNLQVISALVDIQTEMGASTVPAAALARIGQHTRALAALHDLLTQQSKIGAPTDAISASAIMDRLVPLLQVTCAPRNIQFNVDEFPLTVGQGTSLALLVSELVSNAVKHGKGDVGVTLTTQDDTAQLEVCDDGPGFCPDFDWRTAGNTGLSLIDYTGKHDLHGAIVYENRRAGGARVLVRFPIPNVSRQS